VNTCSTHAENDPVTAPSSASPQTIRTAAMTRPPAVTGTASPYPTVVSVSHAHHTASPKVRIVVPGAPRSCWYTASAAEKPSSSAVSEAYAITRAYRLSRGRAWRFWSAS
jgi:hypothetical protein